MNRRTIGIVVLVLAVVAIFLLLVPLVGGPDDTGLERAPEGPVEGPVGSGPPTQAAPSATATSPYEDELMGPYGRIPAEGPN